MADVMEKIHEELNNRQIVHHMAQCDGEKLIVVPIKGRHMIHEFLIEYQNQQESEAWILIPKLVKIPENKFEQAYELLNRFHNTYSFYCFALMDDGAVRFAHSMIPYSGAPEKQVVKLLSTGIQILNECVPDLLRLVYM